MAWNQSNKLEIWGYDFQGIKNSFKAKGTLGSTHGMKYHSAVKGDPLLTHTTSWLTQKVVSVRLQLHGIVGKGKTKGTEHRSGC